MVSLGARSANLGVRPGLFYCAENESINVDMS